MLQRLIHRLLLRRHFWRHATFSEVAELYASRTLRAMAVNISAVLMSVYLYQNGYSVQFIAGYWTIYYVLKIFMAFPAAKYVAAFGPKHAILLANLLYIPAMIAFTFVPTWGITAMIVTGVLQGLSATIYNLGYLIDFSKVKSIEHAGKEIGYMNIFEKVAKGLSPLIGGLLAFLAGPEATLYAAAGLFAVASIPLFQTAELTKSQYGLKFRGFPWRKTWRSMVAETGVGFDFVASGTVWSLLVAIAILGIDGDRVYAELGALLSVVLFAALISSYVYGKLIDKRRGGELLRISVIMSALIHTSRPFVHTVGMTVGTNIANEAATTGYAMAFTRGLFDLADLSGHRVTYLACVEVMANLGAALAGAVFMLFVMLYGDIDGMRAFFFVAAAMILVVALPKFPLYRK
ncbi:MAG TPA: MFS transporter [Candidatus Saccharimonadales bacterium]|nr:MFS transporter [Candidatus Saccharimonadales bacterium]